MAGSRVIVPELYCSDFARTLRFYVDAIGFEVLYRRDEDRFAYLSLDGADLMIEQTIDVARRLTAAETVYPFGRGVNLQIPVDDVEDLFSRLSARGIPMFWPLEERWYRRGATELGVRQFVAMDPDGYLLRFAQSLDPH